MKANASKRKEMKAKVLFFLSFIFPNLGFSMGYGDLNKKLSPLFGIGEKCSKTHASFLLLYIAAPRPGIPATGKNIAHILSFEKLFLEFCILRSLNCSFAISMT